MPTYAVDVRCPRCGAFDGERCMGRRDGEYIKRPHWQRVARAKDARKAGRK